MSKKALSPELKIVLALTAVLIGWLLAITVPRSERSNQDSSAIIGLQSEGKVFCLDGTGSWGYLPQNESRNLNRWDQRLFGLRNGKTSDVERLHDSADRPAPIPVVPKADDSNIASNYKNLWHPVKKRLPEKYSPQPSDTEKKTLVAEKEPDQSTVDLAKALPPISTDLTGQPSNSKPSDLASTIETSAKKWGNDVKIEPLTTTPFTTSEKPLWDDKIVGPPENVSTQADPLAADAKQALDRSNERIEEIEKPLSSAVQTAGLFLPVDTPMDDGISAVSALETTSDAPLSSKVSYPEKEAAPSAATSQETEEVEYLVVKQTANTNQIAAPTPVTVYIAKEGERAEEIAQRFKINSSQIKYFTDINGHGFELGKPLHAGTQILIPVTDEP